MKKILTFILSFMMIICGIFVTACNNNHGGTSDEGSTSMDLGDYTGQTLEVTAIDKGYGYSFIKDAAKVFNKATGSVINVKGDETLNDSIARVLEVGTNVSDIYFTFSSNLQWIGWATKGYLENIDNLIPDERFSQVSASKLGIFNGHRFFYPLTSPPTGFVYNKDYLDRIPSYGKYVKGVFPETFQGLLDLCESVINTRLINNGTKVMPFSWGATVGDIVYLFNALWKSYDPEGFTSYFSQTDVNATDTESNKALIVNDKVKTVIEKIYALYNPKQNVNGDWYPSYGIKDAVGQNNIEAEESFINGYSLFTLSGSWFEKEMLDQIEDTEANFYRFAAIPSLEDNGEKTSYINYGEYFCVTKCGKNKNVDLAKAFISYLFSEESCIKIHSALQTPLPYTYDRSKVKLSTWGKDVLKVVDNDLLADATSDSIINLSGALNTLMLATPLLRLASSPTCNADVILNNFYSVQKQDWNTRLKDLV